MFQSLLIRQTRWTPYGTYLQGLVCLLARFLFALLGFLVDCWCLNSEKEYDSLTGFLRRNYTSLPPSGETDAGMPSSSHALSAMLSFLGWALSRYPLYRRLGGPQGRSGQVQKISPPTGIRSPDRPGRSQSLYRLSYRANNCKNGVNFQLTKKRWANKGEKKEKQGESHLKWI